ncbi:hypothetical protein CQW23_32164 [Capsicum baccatum]|uniref:Uncharacterized protein n=1 Tax=Capsicum baccatum TaxID=33114 RepID=A0A2G2V5J2_CAPBA|nr:hypothetical protein CQW23_32164 [Capsicum baccatum]
METTRPGVSSNEKFKDGDQVRHKIIKVRHKMILDAKKSSLSQVQWSLVKNKMWNSFLQHVVTQKGWSKLVMPALLKAESLFRAIRVVERANFFNNRYSFLYLTMNSVQSQFSNKYSEDTVPDSQPHSTPSIAPIGSVESKLPLDSKESFLCPANPNKARYPGKGSD